MHTHPLFKITLVLTIALLATLMVTGIAYAQEPVPQSTDPVSNTHTAPLTTTVSITYDQPMSTTTVTSRTFAVHAIQTGLLTETLGVDGGTIILTPTNAFFPGEMVQATATTSTLNLTGTAPISPTVWQFWVEAGVGPVVFNEVSNNFGPSNDGTFSVVYGDVDGDGDLDLAVGNYGQNVVYLNDGDGTFDTTSYNFGTGSDATFRVALGDVDGDGDLDLAVGNTNQQNVVYLNNGDGTFHATGNSFGPVGDNTSSVAFGDLDGDGHLDLAVGNYYAQNVVYLNNGDGTFPATGNNSNSHFDIKSGWYYGGTSTSSCSSMKSSRCSQLSNRR